MRTLARIALAMSVALVAGLAPAVAAQATVYVAPSGSDTAPCSQAAPCKSFSRAYQASPAGGEVEVAGGTYGGQSLSNVNKGGGAKVVIRPASGASVTLTGSLSFSNGDDVEVRNMKVGGWGVTNGSQHVILRNIVATDLVDAAGYFSGSDDVQVIGGEIARVDPNDGIHMNNGGGSNSNIVIDGLYEHDLTVNRDSASHDDCIQTGDVTNLVIRNSRFVNCGTQGVFLNPYNGGVTRNVTIENNFFGQAQLGYNILYIGDAVGVTVRNNSFVGQVTSYNPASFTKLVMVNNVFAGNDAYNCADLASKSATFAYNASSSSCGSAKNHLTKANIGSAFVNTSASSLDLHLKAGSALIDKGAPLSSSAANDFDGQARPIGGAADIGADEYGAGPAGPPSTPGQPSTPTTPTTPSTPGTPATPATPAPSATPASAPTSVAALLATLPADAAAALRKADAADAGSGFPLTAVGIDDSTVCHRARKGCPGTTKLRIVLAKATKAKLSFRKVRAGKRMARVKLTTFTLRKGVNVVKLKSRGLGAGRYHLVLTTANGASADVVLRIR
jgi:hypothetical protein